MSGLPSEVKTVFLKKYNAEKKAVGVTAAGAQRPELVEEVKAIRWGGVQHRRDDPDPLATLYF
eukprot:SAG22_NODE_551_length_9178_cov_3.565371_4_plen_63_part_00